MRVAIAIIAGLVILAVGFSTIRGLVGGRAGGAAASLPEPVPRDVRVMFWCENCGMETVLVVQGSTGTAPRHCGESMHRREEVLHQN